MNSLLGDTRRSDISQKGLFGILKAMTQNTDLGQNV